MKGKFDMIDNIYIQELINDYRRLKTMGYVEFPNNYSAGINLENMLNKTGGSFNIPDFGDVEIKTIEYKKIYKDFSLFTCRPDGPYVLSIQQLAKKYGYPDKDFRSINVIKGDIVGNKLSKIGLFYYFKLIVDIEKNKVNLAVYDYNKIFIGIEAFWDFDSLMEKFERKYKNLAIFYYDVIYNNGRKKYWFNHLELYCLKDKNNFIKLLNDGVIKMTLTCGVAKSGSYRGKFIDHGTAFRISRHDIGKLFNRIYFMD